jgi:hypothetical protein
VVTELLVLSEAGEAAPPDAAVDPLRAAGAPRRAGRPRRVGGRRGRDGASVRCVEADLDRILDVLIENAHLYGPAGQRDGRGRRCGPDHGDR